MFLTVSQNSQENTCVRSSFLIKLQLCNFVKKETPTQVLSCKLYEIFKSTLLIEHHQWVLLTIHDHCHHHHDRRHHVMCLQTIPHENTLYSWLRPVLHSSRTKASFIACFFLCIHCRHDELWILWEIMLLVVSLKVLFHS